MYKIYGSNFKWNNCYRGAFQDAMLKTYRDRIGYRNHSYWPGIYMSNAGIGS